MTYPGLRTRLIYKRLRTNGGVVKPERFTTEMGDFQHRSVASTGEAQPGFVSRPVRMGTWGEGGSPDRHGRHHGRRRAPLE
jgi:hypothetical protein